MTKFLNISTDGTLAGNSDSTVVSEKAIKTYADTKQAQLVSGTNIKTVNGNSLLGSGDVSITQAVAWGNITGTLSDQTDLQNVLNAKVNTSALAAVATSGLYSDLSGTPTIPTTLAELTGDVSLTSPTDGQVLTYDNGDWINADATGGYHPDIFDWKWADHELNDVQWLRADTFSWQDGTVYSNAYNHLVDDMDGISPVWETVGSHQVAVYNCADGHKVCTPDQETNIQNIYNESGVAWYYVLDTVNQRFKLPRAKHNKYSATLSVVGNGITLGVTDGSNNNGLVNSSNGPAFRNNAYGGTVGLSYSGSVTLSQTQIGLTADPTKSGIIAQQTQDTDQYKYLYFYVGNFTQTALENTAGLNASLFNAKVDITSSWGSPDTTVPLTAVVSGGTFVAPEDGFIRARATGTAAGQYLELVDSTMDSLVQTGGANIDVAVFIPVKKGTTVTTYYSTNTPTFSFTYAQKTN